MSKLLIIFILLIVNLGFSLFIILPSYQSLMFIKAQVYNREAELDFRQKHIVRLEEISENIKGQENLLQALKDCMASIFTNRDIEYRDEKGIDHLKNRKKNRT